MKADRSSSRGVGRTDSGTCGGGRIVDRGVQRGFTGAGWKPRNTDDASPFLDGDTRNQRNQRNRKLDGAGHESRRVRVRVALAPRL